MEASKKHISYSQLRMFQKCPLQWQKMYINKEGVYQANIYGTFGEAVHQCIQHYELKQNNYVKGTFKEFLISVYNENRKKDTTFFIHDLEVNKWSEIGETHVIRYLQNYLFGVEGWQLIDTEFKLSVPIEGYQNINFIGYIDLLFLSKDECTIKLVDLKTSSKGWGKGELFENYKQLHLYAFYLRCQTTTVKPLETSFVLFNRKYPEKIVYSTLESDTDREVNTYWELMGMLSQAFNKDGSPLGMELPARPSNNACMFCQFKNTCKHSFFKERKEQILYY